MRWPVRQSTTTKSATGELVMNRFRPLTTHPSAVCSASVCSASTDRSLEALGSVVADLLRLFGQQQVVEEAVGLAGRKGHRHAQPPTWNISIRRRGRAVAAVRSSE